MSSYSDLTPFFLIKDHVHLRNLTAMFAASITSSLVVPTIRLGEMPDFLTQWESLEWFPENVHVVYDGASADIEGTEEGVKLLSFPKTSLTLCTFTAGIRLTWAAKIRARVIICLTL